ncbi:WG repeat-containing protein [Cloacibacterium sp. Arc13]|uniref:WG repeat-containing protein n=1 Tax=unclassified Cloacibacterium TaxID=2620870 RepID=UPI00352F5032
MKNIVQLFLLLISSFYFSQQDTNWYTFYNSDSTKIGYKDAKGKVRIEPKFELAMTNSKVFKDVVIVWEYAKNYSGEKYYLNKEGKKFGKDSIYIFDFTFAEESEGKIKFRDSKTDKVGFFDKNGQVVIPAIYNDAGDFHNGLAMIMKDGVRKCWKENNEKQPEYPNCEHWSWEGKTIMINTNNQELFEIPKENFTNSIDYNNVYKNFKLNENVDSDIYTSYKGNDGNIYSFYSPEKDFKKWFETQFLPDFKTNGRIIGKYFNNSIELQIEESSVIIDKKDFITKGFNKNINKLFDDYIKNKYSVDYFNENIFNEDSRDISIDVRFTSKIENKDDKSVRKFSQKSIIFKKIGNSFYITTTY